MPRPHLYLVKSTPAAWERLRGSTPRPLERLSAAGAAYLGRRISGAQIAAGIAVGVAIGLWCRAELAPAPR